MSLNKKILGMLINSKTVSYMNEKNVNLTKDFGSALLENKIFDFKERIPTDIDNSLSLKLGINNLDKFLMNLIIENIKQKFNIKENKITYISLPQVSSSFSILLTYDIVFCDIALRLLNQHKVNNNYDFIKFKNGEGILLVSHNIDLLQHVFNSSFMNEHLKDYLPTYMVQSEQLNRINFTNTKDDGSLPWIGFYRAHRKDLVSELEKKTKIIIVDLMPTYHRKRAKQLIDWAKEKAEHVIVVLPSNDMPLSYFVEKDAFTIPVNQSTNSILERIIPYEIASNDLPTWGTKHCLEIIKGEHIKFKLNEYSFIDRKIIQALEDYEENLNLCRKSNGMLPEKIRFIDNLKYLMLNIISPLTIYEKSKSDAKEITIFGQYLKFKQIRPSDNEEVSIESFLIHHYYKAFEQIYNLVMELNTTLRGNILFNLIRNERLTKITIIVFNKYEKQLIIDQLIYYSSKIFEILTFKEFHENQLKNMYPETEVFIITTPFPNKYLSAFNFKNVRVEFISILNDKSRYYKQIEFIYKDERESKKVIESLKQLNITVTGNTLFTNTPRINVENGFRFIISDKSELVRTDELNITIFDDIKLLELLNNNVEYNFDLSSLINNISEFSNSNKSMAQLIELEDFEGNKELLFLPIDDHIRVRKFNKDLIENTEVSELMENDLWIRVNHDMRMDLFNEILNLAASTSLMKWINYGVDIWNEILITVWNKYYRGQRFKKYVYEDILRDLKIYGGNVTNYTTIANWFNRQNIVRDQENLHALIKISEKKEFEQSMRIVLSSVTKLRSIHIQLGRTISQIINSYSKQILQYNTVNDWIRIGDDITIPTEDIATIIKIYRVSALDTNKKVVIPNEILYKNIEIDLVNEILNKYAFQEENI